MHIWIPARKTHGGADVYLRALKSGLEQRGHRVDIAYRPAWSQYFPWTFPATAVPAGADIILADSNRAHTFADVGKPLVVLEHHSVLDPAYRPYRSWPQALYHESLARLYAARSVRAADLVLTVSDYSAAALRKIFATDKVRAIPSGVDTEFFSPPSAPPSRSDGWVNLLYVGNHSRRKGTELLPAIMARLGPQFRLRCTGGLRAEAAVTWPRTEFLGRLSDAELRSAYRDADLLLFPSRFEGFGYPLVEAMACGVPVVCSNNSSLAEIVVDHETGVLCPTDDIEAFVAALTTMAAKPELRARYARQARARVETFYSAERWITDLETVLLNLLQAA